MIRWPSVMYAKSGITNTVWTFLVMFLVIQRSLGSVKYALVCGEPVSVEVDALPCSYSFFVGVFHVEPLHEGSNELCHCRVSLVNRASAV